MNIILSPKLGNL